MIEQFKEDARLIIRESIEQHVGQPYQRVDEALGTTLVALGFVGGALGIWNKLRNNILKNRDEAVVQIFWEKEDPNGSIDRMVNDIERRFRLVKTLDDVDRMRKEAEKVNSRLNDLVIKSRGFTEEDFVSILGKSTDFSNRFFRLNPSTETKRLQKIVVKIAEDYKRYFETKMDELENNILG